MPFFADATLDLEEAHDIADTPEATRPQFNAFSIQAHRTRLQVPSLLNLTEIRNDEDGGSSNNNKKKPPAAARASSPAELQLTVPEQNSSSRHQNNFPVSSLSDPSAPSDEKASFVRITGKSHLETDHAVFRNAETAGALVVARKPKWPRDLPWTVTFFLLVPTTLIYPLVRGGVGSDSSSRSQLSKHPLSFATLHAITWTTVAVILVTRGLYRSAAGGEGDSARSRAAFVMATAAPCSVVVYVALAVTVWLACPTTRYAALLPAFYALRDVYSLRRWNRRTPQTGAGYASRIAFFQAVTNMALDILSRSLRRASFYRALSAILLLQLNVLLWWRASLLGALSMSLSGSYYSYVLLLLTFGAGKWAAATIMRMLTLLASAGVMHWCAEQGALLSEMSHRGEIPNGNQNNGRDQQQQNQPPAVNNEGGESDEYDGTRSVESSGNSIPEAYRTVDASVYQSVLDMDDALDDDYDDLDGEVVGEARAAFDGTNRHHRRAGTAGGSSMNQQQQQRATVKSILWTGVTINFGAIAHCGLLGGPAQFVWSQVRNVEAARTAISLARGGGGEFQGMHIGGGATTGGTGFVWTKINILARNFVRHHSDLAVTHVAAYYKGYVRAARDVASLIDESGALEIFVVSFAVEILLARRLTLNLMLARFFHRIRTDSARGYFHTHVHMYWWINYRNHHTNHFLLAAPPTQEPRRSQRRPRG